MKYTSASENYNQETHLKTPQCITQISNKTPFCDRNVHTCAYFCHKSVQCGIWDWCIVGFGQQVYCNIFVNANVIK